MRKNDLFNTTRKMFYERLSENQYDIAFGAIELAYEMGVLTSREFDKLYAELSEHEREHEMAGGDPIEN